MPSASSRTANENDCDVLILGAGAAGLNAARSLVTDHRVIVLEARDRVGGRLFTRRHAGQPTPVELGPEFVHGRMPETFELLDESGLIAYDLADRHVSTRDGKPITRDKDWEAAHALLDRVGRGQADESFESFLKRAGRISPKVRQLATGFVEGFNAADRRRISCRSIRRAADAEAAIKNGDKQFRLVGGYDQLANALAGRVCDPSRIDFSTVVCAVNWEPRRVEVIAQSRVDGSSRRYTARACIVALPLGVLQIDPETPAAVQFHPELPLREAIHDRLVMGSVVKLTVRFSEPFWERRKGFEDLSFVHRPDAAIPVWWGTLPLRTALLTGWAGGPAAEALWAGDLHAHAVDSLSKIFAMPRATIGRLIERIDHHDWQNDPFCRGAYSYAAVGGADLPDRLARPIKDTLFFAGEHTHGDFLGTVAGALASGKAAARRVGRGLQ